MNITRKYVWIVTRTNEAGVDAVVVSHHETRDSAQQKSKFVNFGGYEGPVPADLYPVGKVFTLKEQS